MATTARPVGKRWIGGGLVFLLSLTVSALVGCVLGALAYPAYFALRDPGSVSFAKGHYYIIMTASAPDCNLFLWVGTVVGSLAGVYLGLWLLRRLYGRGIGR